MPSLTRLTLTLPPGHAGTDADMLCALLALHVSHGWEEQSLPTGEQRCLVHSPLRDFCEALGQRLAQALPCVTVDLEEVEETNWVEAWKEFFTPVECGDHFLVLAPWMERERAETSRIPIIIEPKTAFGTGHHATTALCLEALSLLHAQGRLARDLRFLDLGTGSGILGLGCAKLGLSGEGLDIDPPAVQNSLENRALNAVAPERFEVRLGGIEEASGPYDLILANILAEPLKSMAPAMASLPGAGSSRPLLVLSGLLDIQADAVAATYTACGFPEPRKLLRGEWAALIFDPEQAAAR